MSTEQKRHALVQTEPITMIVAVPLLQHSFMLGQWLSSQTVDKRWLSTVFLTDLNSGVVWVEIRNHDGLRALPTVGLGAWPLFMLEPGFTPSLIAVNPCGVTNFTPLLTLGLGEGFCSALPGCLGRIRCRF